MKTAIISSLALLTLVSVASAQITASVPYTEDFNSASVGGEWTFAHTSTFGRIQFTSNGSVSPLSGGAALVMDVSTSGTQTTNTGTLRVDLSPTSGGILRYYFKETSDENHTQDGVFVSDGTTTVLAQSHQNGPQSWTEYTVDLTALILANGLNINVPTQIIFSHRDNFPIPTDGFFFDDIRVSPPPVPDTGQANSAVASLIINNGQNPNGEFAVQGINGPFFASGNTLDITVSGQPNQGWILMLGPLNRNNWVIPTVGSLDVGLLGPGVISDIAFVLDGISGQTFFDQFAVTGATGVSNLSFGMAAVPNGLLGTFQVIILNAGGAQIALTTAFEFTVTP